MHDKKFIDAAISQIVNKGGSRNITPTPSANFGQRMAAHRVKTPRNAGTQNRASSTAPPTPPSLPKTKGKAIKVLQPKTTIPAPAKAKAAPGMGKNRGSHAVTINNHFYGSQPSENDGDE